jgi:hypothetical protein
MCVSARSAAGVGLLEMMNAPIEREQELEPVFGLTFGHIIS